eukprot:CAMPEP_0185036210 /NCGR_PEP_ID=MMETSP1103-20130426/28829_1 /TAXON_ID=36769 /ORGANISM="Paraphysomonas bandaiensis, Strain Caron Lab Isolate" /LENGTH=484 /DNA_ID=CAMNT_0027573667 /DNA_START=147 /DNA_END=1601 /DNA_ORIENTATION=+
MTLLHSIAAVRENWKAPINTHIIHFNHKARIESDEEETFVRHWADVYNMPIHVFAFPEMDRRSIGFQARAREWRRHHGQQVLRNLWQGCSGSASILTGHHAEDQVETRVMRLLRGTHLSRLSAMQSKEGFYARPLIPLRKSDLIGYMRERGLEWREDVSNTDCKYTRNAVRLRLLPEMEKSAGGWEALHRRLLDLEQQSRHLRNWIEKETNDFMTAFPDWLQEFPNLNRVEVIISNPFRKLSPLVQTELLRILVDRCGSPSHKVCEETEELAPFLSHRQTERLLSLALSAGEESGDSGNAHVPSALTLSREFRAVKEGSKLIIHRINLKTDTSVTTVDNFTFQNVQSGPYSISIHHPQDIQISVERHTCKCKVCDAIDYSKPRHGSISLRGGSVILCGIPTGAQLGVRFRKAGDKFHPPWRSESIRLKDFLREISIPVGDRDSVPLIDMDGQVIAVPPYTASQFSCSSIGEVGNSCIVVKIGYQ